METSETSVSLDMPQCQTHLFSVLHTSVLQQSVSR